MVMLLAVPVTMRMRYRCGVVRGGSGGAIRVSCLIVTLAAICIKVVRCIWGQRPMTTVMLVVRVVMVVWLFTDSCGGCDCAG